jgi:predicted  nucleic acid-binding Zn-ribbon protein
MVATVFAKIGAMRLMEMSTVRQRSLEHRKMILTQELATLQGERELLRRDHVRARQEVLALKDQVFEVRADLEAIETQGERRNQRLARSIGAEPATITTDANSILAA